MMIDACLPELDLRSTYYLRTYGCQMNEHDSEKTRGMLDAMGLSEVADPEEAGVVLLNTCCVRERAENKALGLIGQMKDLKRRHPNVLIGVMGCMSQQSDIRDRLIRQHSHVDLIMGTHNLDRLPELLLRVAQERGRVIDVLDDERQNLFEGIPTRRSHTFKAFVSVMYGCDNFCSYCVVPYVRGRERSREPESVLSEVRNLAASGCVEVTLLGQNVNSYGKGLLRKVTFADLLRRVAAIRGIERVRFVTSHPKDLSDELIEVMAHTSEVCPHLHLPLQSGSDRILKLMHRGYTIEEYEQMVVNARRAIHGLSLTTDLMVGFPGETSQDFEEMLEAVRRIEFDAAFTFAYSERPGTAALRLPDPVPPDIRLSRLHDLIQCQNEISLRKNREREGGVEVLLVEGPSPRNAEIWQGRSGSNLLVNFAPSAETRIGGTERVTITTGHTWTLNGRILPA